MRSAHLKVWLHRFRQVVPAAALALVSMPVLAQGAYTPSPRIRDLAIGVCGACHGVDGHSTNPMFPNLAGQKAWYLAQQLKEFRAHTRGDPYAVGYMWGMASQLSNASIAALAKYFSEQKPSAGTAHPAARIREGQQIYHQGIPSEGVPACAACHGPNGLGNAHFPRLAGQHAEYIRKQLDSFRSDMRDVMIMHAICTTLHVRQDRALADYLASLPDHDHGHGTTLARAAAGPAAARSGQSG